MQDSLRAEASHHLVSQQPSVRVSPLSSPVEDERQVGQTRRLARQQVKLQLPALPHEVRLQELDEEALAQRPMRSTQEECRRRKSDLEQIARNEERDQRTENGFERVPPRQQTAVDDDQSTSNKFLKLLNSNVSSNKLFENERIKKCIFCASLTVRQEIAQDSKNKVSKSLFHLFGSVYQQVFSVAKELYFISKVSDFLNVNKKRL